MSTDRLIPPEVEILPPEAVLDEAPDSLGAPRQIALPLTPEERGMLTKVIAEHVANLERIPTADLSTAALRRLTLVAIEVSGADPLGGEPPHTLGSGNDPGLGPSKRTGTRRRSKSTGLRTGEPRGIRESDVRGRGAPGR
jgi:hypothetical protein